MPARVRALPWIAGFVLLGAVAPASAQSSVGGPAQASFAGPARANFVSPPRDPEPPEALPDLFSSVNLIDDALPRTMLRLRGNLASGFRRPTMGELFQPKGGLPFSPGPPRPETNIDYQEMETHLEYAVDTWFSVFLETPVRWLNPEQNANTWGQGDASLGCKLCVFQTETFLTTFQLRLYTPTARNNALGTDHWTIEPGLLANFRLADMFTLEGELRYIAPLGGTDFAGDVLRYGIGLSLGQQPANQIWVTPVVEAVGWSFLGGKALAVAPGFVGIESLSGETVVNGQAGLRLGLGHSADFYAGYSHSLTGPRLYRDMVRVEFRLQF
ncbi:MAG: transporter [Gemmataceae bacterium]